MKFLQEITEWDVPNHVYVLNDSRDKMYGYVPRGTDHVIEVTKPYRFSVSHRKFKEVANVYGYSRAEEAEVLPGKEYLVQGSGKNIYSVRDDRGAWSCTCPASKWQKGGECKHIKLTRSQTQPA